MTHTNLVLIGLLLLVIWLFVGSLVVRFLIWILGSIIKPTSDGEFFGMCLFWPLLLIFFLGVALVSYLDDGHPKTTRVLGYVLSRPFVWLGQYVKWAMGGS